jgi:hypothetical protein
MKNYLNRRDDPIEALAGAIYYLADVLAGNQAITKQDLDNLELNIMAKLSQIKADVAKVNADLTEGLAEISDRLDELVAANQDPEVTDEVFTANLEAVKAKAVALANIANPPPSTDSGSGTPTV